jgi:DNA-binding response OmpR family regulator
MAAKILVVEDDQFLRDLYNELLTEAGYTVETAADGEEGLIKARGGGFDLVLLDIMLPKLDGLGVLRGLKDKAPSSPNGPVVLLTNLGQDAIIKEGFNLGATGYIIKSAMTPEQVLSEVKVFLKQN